MALELRFQIYTLEWKKFRLLYNKKTISTYQVDYFGALQSKCVVQDSLNSNYEWFSLFISENFAGENQTNK